MTKSFERFLRRTLWTLTVFCAAGAVLLLVQIRLMPEQPLAPGVRAATPHAEPQPGAKEDKTIEQLAQTRMTRTIVPAKEQKAAPPPTPPLATLIQIKGIMEYDKPDTNEAVIETLLSRQARSYRIGESVDGVPTKILKIGSKVTFQYNGGSVELGVNDGGRADMQPIAKPGDESGIHITSNDRSEAR